jgi:hypothetical protein
MSSWAWQVSADPTRQTAIPLKIEWIATVHLMLAGIRRARMATLPKTANPASIPRLLVQDVWGCQQFLTKRQDPLVAGP